MRRNHRNARSGSNNSSQKERHTVKKSHITSPSTSQLRRHYRPTTSISTIHTSCITVHRRTIARQSISPRQHETSSHVASRRSLSSTQPPSEQRPPVKLPTRIGMFLSSMLSPEFSSLQPADNYTRKAVIASYNVIRPPSATPFVVGNTHRSTDPFEYPNNKQAYHPTSSPDSQPTPSSKENMLKYPPAQPQVPQRGNNLSMAHYARFYAMHTPPKVLQNIALDPNNVPQYTFKSIGDHTSTSHQIASMNDGLKANQHQKLTQDRGVEASQISSSNTNQSKSSSSSSSASSYQKPMPPPYNYYHTIPPATSGGSSTAGTWLSSFKSWVLSFQYITIIFGTTFALLLIAGLGYLFYGKVIEGQLSEVAVSLTTSTLSSDQTQVSVTQLAESIIHDPATLRSVQNLFLSLLNQQELRDTILSTLIHILQQPAALQQLNQLASDVVVNLSQDSEVVSSLSQLSSTLLADPKTQEQLTLVGKQTLNDPELRAEALSALVRLWTDFSSSEQTRLQLQQVITKVLEDQHVINSSSNMVWKTLKQTFLPWGRSDGSSDGHFPQSGGVSDIHLSNLHDTVGPSSSRQSISPAQMIPEHDQHPSHPAIVDGDRNQVLKTTTSSTTVHDRPSSPVSSSSHVAETGTSQGPVSTTLQQSISSEGTKTNEKHLDTSIKEPRSSSSSSLPSSSTDGALLTGTKEPEISNFDYVTGRVSEAFHTFRDKIRYLLPSDDARDTPLDAVSSRDTPQQQQQTAIAPVSKKLPPNPSLSQTEYQGYPIYQQETTRTANPTQNFSLYDGHKPDPSTSSAASPSSSSSEIRSPAKTLPNPHTPQQLLSVEPTRAEPQLPTDADVKTTGYALPPRSATTIPLNSDGYQPFAVNRSLLSPTPYTSHLPVQPPQQFIVKEDPFMTSHDSRSASYSSRSHPVTSTDGLHHTQSHHNPKKSQ